MWNIDANQYLSQLIDQYGNLVFSICYKITNHYFDAEDLTQETFLSVYHHLDTFDGNNEQAWICKIATNKCLDYIKSVKRKTLPAQDSFFHQYKSKEATPEEHILCESTKEQLHSLCCQLKSPYKEVAIEYFCNEKTISEMEKSTGRKIKTLQTQIYRSKTMLRDLWRKEEEQ